MALVDHPERLDRASAAVLGRRLVWLEAGRVHPRHVGAWVAVGDPVGDYPSDPRPAEDADRIQTGGNEVVADLGCRADDRAQVGGETLRSAEEGADAGVVGDRHAAHRRLDVLTHPIPVGLQGGERGVARDPVDVPGGAHRLEQPDHQTAGLFAVVAEVGRVFDHRPGRVDVRHLFGDEVVVLGGLERDRHARQLTELAGPHSGCVHDILALDRALVGHHSVDRAAADEDVGDGDALDDRDALLAGAFGERHRGVDRIDPPVALDVEPCQQIVSARQREQLGHLGGRDLVHVDPAVSVEGSDPPVLLEASFVGGQFDESDRLEPGRQPGLGLESGVEVAGVLAQLGRCFRRRAERDHQPRRVPGGAGGELVALDQHRVGPSEVSQVVGDRRADHPAPDDHDPGPRRQLHHRHMLRTGVGHSRCACSPGVRTGPGGTLSAMSPTTATAPKPGSGSGRVPLSRERIVAAALELSDLRGDFSMRALGEQLGVDPMAIYRHFEHKHALLDAIVDAALADLEPAPPEAGTPIERLRQLCVDFRHSLSMHPGVAHRIRTTLPALGPHVVALTEASLGLIREVGVDPSEAPRVFTLLIRFVTSMVEEEEHVLADSGSEQAWRSAVQARYALLPSGSFPNVAAMAAELAESSYQDDFEYGLDLQLDAIVRHGSSGHSDS